MNTRYIKFRWIKRAIDIVGAITGLFIFSPVILVLALAIKYEDGGAVFYSQKRIGQNNEAFTIWKFRSMVEDAHERRYKLVSQKINSESLTFKVRDDPRVTNIGKFMRNHSLDEIPQFWNVLIGDMSLVGPRPALPEEVSEYKSDKEFSRLNVLPGLSGLWQVSGRSDLPYQEMIKLDTYYVENWSLFLDFSILVKTVLQMFATANNGAY